jgi:hypothetical protein
MESSFDKYLDVEQEMEITCDNNYEGILSATKKIESSFKDFYSRKGYQEIPPVPIASGIDETVRFIGSHISVMKPHILDPELLGQGVYMSQDCIRTKNVDKLFDDEYVPRWGSYFRSIGALAPAEKTTNTFNELMLYLQEELGLSIENILFRINSEDEDLMQLLEDQPSQNIELNSKPESYYRHKIGIDGIRGRNFNIALLNEKNGSFNDIGNFILLENETQALAVETAIGISTTVKQIEQLDSVMECNPVPFLDSLNLEERFSKKIQDAITVSSILYQEGLRPLGSGNKNRILQKYVKALSYLRFKTNISLDQVQDLIDSFKATNELLISGKEREGLTDSELIKEYLKSYEEEIKFKSNLSKIDQKILNEFT